MGINRPIKISPNVWPINPTSSNGGYHPHIGKVNIGKHPIVEYQNVVVTRERNIVHSKNLGDLNTIRQTFLILASMVSGGVKKLSSVFRPLHDQGGKVDLNLFHQVP